MVIVKTFVFILWLLSITLINLVTYAQSLFLQKWNAGQRIYRNCWAVQINLNAQFGQWYGHPEHLPECWNSHCAVQIW